MTNETTAAADQAHDPEDDLPEQMRIRRDKRERLAEIGIEPYPVGVPVTTTIQAVRAYAQSEPLVPKAKGGAKA